MEQTNLPTLTNQTTQTGLATPDAILERLREFANDAQGAYAKNTERAFRSDIAIFVEHCANRGVSSLPATPEVVADFVDTMCSRCKPATIRRYLSSIATYHKAAGLESPTITLKVKLALKRMGRATEARQDQAEPMNRGLVDEMMEADRGTFRDARDVAMIAVAYDTLCRRSEIVALDVEDFSFTESGTGTVLVRRSKTDQKGAGMVRFIAPDTVTLVNNWMGTSGIDKGAMFRGIDNADMLTGRLSDKGLVRAFKRFAKLAGENPENVSGHSCRVGAAQDMVAAGLDISGVMQAGGWKSPVMVARYTANLMVERGAAAKLAALQKRM